LDRSILSYPLFSNKYLNGGILVGLVLMAVAIYLPELQTIFNTVALPLNWVIGVVLIGVINIILIEITKWFFRSRQVIQLT